MVPGGGSLTKKQLLLSASVSPAVGGYPTAVGEHPTAVGGYPTEVGGNPNNTLDVCTPVVEGNGQVIWIRHRTFIEGVLAGKAEHVEVGPNHLCSIRAAHSVVTPPPSPLGAWYWQFAYR